MHRYKPLTKGRPWLLGILLGAVLALAGCDDPEGASAGADNPVDETAAQAVGFIVSPEPALPPPLQFTDGEGQPLELEAFRGKVVLLNLWATWCRPCREEMPTLDALQAELGGPEFQVVPLSIDQEGLGVIKRFYKEIDLQQLGIYNDKSGQAAVKLGALGIPTTLLLDREGREVARLVGEKHWDTPEMVAFLRSVVEATADESAGKAGS